MKDPLHNPRPHGADPNRPGSYSDQRREFGTDFFRRHMAGNACGVTLLHKKIEFDHLIFKCLLALKAFRHCERTEAV